MASSQERICEQWVRPSHREEEAVEADNEVDGDLALPEDPVITGLLNTLPSLPMLVMTGLWDSFG